MTGHFCSLVKIYSKSRPVIVFEMCQSLFAASGFIEWGRRPPAKLSTSSDVISLEILRSSQYRPPLPSKSGLVAVHRGVAAPWAIVFK